MADRLTPEDAIAGALLRWQGDVGEHAREIAQTAVDALAGHGYMHIHVGSSSHWERLARRMRGAARFLMSCAESLDAMHVAAGQTAADEQSQATVVVGGNR